MFSLIITIIGIVLVVALIFATMFYGTPQNEASAQIEAARILNQSQQLTSATEVYYADQGVYPASVQALIDGGYLTANPQASLGLLSVAHAASPVAEWRMPVSGVPVFVLDRQVKSDVCQQVNVKGSLGSAGILRLAYQDLRIQCYGDDADDLTVVVSRTPDAAVTAIGASTSQVPSTADAAAWLVIGDSNNGGQPGQPTEPELPPVSFRVTSGGSTVTNMNSMYWGYQENTVSRSFQIVNTGEGPFTITDIAAEDVRGFSLDQASQCIGAVVQPGGLCELVINNAGDIVGTSYGPLRVTTVEYGELFTYTYGGFREAAVASIEGLEYTNGILDFGARENGVPATASFTLRNTGTRTADFRIQAYTDAPVSLSHTSCNLSENGSCVVTVTWTPQSGQVQNGGLLIVPQETYQGKQAIVNMSGQPDARKEVTVIDDNTMAPTTTFSLGTIQRNGYGFTRARIALANTGTLPVIMADQYMSNTYPGVYINNMCAGAYLNPTGGSVYPQCSIEANFQNPTTVGPFSQTISLQDRTGATVATFTLTGTVTP